MNHIVLKDGAAVTRLPDGWWSFRRNGEHIRATLASLPSDAELERSTGEPQPLTYSSTQATMCAGCGLHKHTPLRIDAMGGYVCLTCIDQKLGSLLGEFGYPDPEPPTDSQIEAAVERAHPIGTAPMGDAS